MCVCGGGLKLTLGPLEYTHWRCVSNKKWMEWNAQDNKIIWLDYHIICARFAFGSSHASSLQRNHDNLKQTQYEPGFKPTIHEVLNVKWVFVLGYGN